MRPLLAPTGGAPRTLTLVAVTILAIVACARAGNPTEKAAGGRIVSVGGPVTETVFALGAGDRVVGVDSSSVFPDEVGAHPQIGYQRTLAAEPILALDPDLVIAVAEAGPPAAIEQLRAAGVRVELMPVAETPEAAAARIRAVAAVLGKETEGRVLAEHVELDAAAARDRAHARGDRPRVLFLYSRGGGNVMVAGRGTAAAAMIELAGGVLAVDDHDGYRPLSAEAMVAAAPDVIAAPSRGLEAMGGVDGALALPGVGATPAGQARRVVALDDLLLLGFGPRLPLAIDALAVAIRAPGGP